MLLAPRSLPPADMTAPVISVRGLSKLYRIGAQRVRYRTLRESLVYASSRLFGRGDRGAAKNTIWALKDVSFDVRRGEAIGVIGRNGAGKSTLLKILSEITYPTEGRVEIRGRVASLLEVGTGFHPELTGRENIFLNGAILGMGRAEIKRKFDEIVAFAEIDRFIDTPVKRYSSGMYVRLAFAVAAHLEPEILLVDEVLAVGDTAFQRKCIGKMNDVATQEGRTVLFVSHNMAAVQSLCSRALLLDQGRVASIGEVEKVIESYLTWHSAHQGNIDLAALSGASGGLLKQFRIVDKTGRPCVAIPLGGSVAFEIEGDSRERVGNAVLNIGLDTLMGQRVASFNTLFQYGSLLALQGPFRMQCRFDNCRLRPGPYLMSVTLKSMGKIVQQVAGVPVEVVATDVYGSGKIPPQDKGVYLPEAVWRIEGPAGNAGAPAGG
jgi:lipopolysaccharide transport system ATP-binding protein